MTDALTPDEIQRLAPGSTPEQPESLEARLRALVATWPTHSNDQPIGLVTEYRRAVTQCANSILALLSDPGPASVSAEDQASERLISLVCGECLQPVPNPGYIVHDCSTPPTVARMRRLPTALSVIEREALCFKCPWCQVYPGVWCLNDSGQPAVSLHASRIDLGAES